METSKTDNRTLDPLTDARYAAFVESLRSTEDRVAARNLLKATRSFLEEQRDVSWLHVGSTLVVLIATLALAALMPWWPLRLLASLASGLLLGRTFILYHDYMHGAILRGSRLGRFVMYTVGLLFLAPPASWRASHNYHHANVAKLNGPAIGSFPMMTVDAWRGATRMRRFRYRFSRHPLTMLAAYLTIFTYSLTLEPLFTHPRRSWDSLLALALHASVIVGLGLVGGASTAFFAFLLPFAIADALGAYLFYAQHNAEGLRMFSAAEWTFFRAALESSTFMRLGPMMTWFLGNIGYHHVHHLNPGIPFYRLPEAMAAIPALQRPTVTSLRPRDIAACLRANLWDETRGAMVSFKSVR
jgi:omega-6 fatty acid desaturase (delta-12 desaturase)